MILSTQKGLIPLIIGCALIFMLVWRPSVMADIAAESVEAGDGFSFRVPLTLIPWHGYSIATDSMDLPRDSRLRLMRDGVGFGTPHSLHSMIRSQGSGAYSHWGTILRFSTPENADPRTDGHRYSYRVPMQMVQSLFVGLLVAAAASLTLAVCRANRYLSLILAIGLVALVWLGIGSWRAYRSSRAAGTT